MTDTARKEWLTRRGELAFLAFQTMFWVGIIYFVGPALQSGYHREHLTPTFWVIFALVLFSCLAIAVSAWLFFLSIIEAKAVVRSADELQISYVHLGPRCVRSDKLRRLRVRLFRFHLDNNFEPAWLVFLGGFRLLTISRTRNGSAL